jgi:hypothetical protein
LLFTLNPRYIASSSASGSNPAPENLPSKADGKKRALDDDDDATATDGETTTSNNPSKKKKKKKNRINNNALTFVIAQPSMQTQTLINFFVLVMFFQSILSVPPRVHTSIILRFVMAP